MKVREKSRGSLKGWQFTHQDQKQVGPAELARLEEGKAIEIPDPDKSTGVRLTFIDFVEPVGKESTGKADKKGDK